MKACSKCNQTKPDKAFALSNKVKSGLASRCKSCESERGKIRYQKIKDKAKAQAIQYRIDNYEKRLEIEKRSKAKNKEKQRPAKNARQNIRNRILQGGKFLILEKELKKIYRSPCFVCGSKTDQSLDHLIPISRGGNHSVGNIITLCRNCNSQKYNKTLTEWRKIK